MKKIILTLIMFLGILPTLFLASCNNNGSGSNSPKTDTVIIKSMAFTPSEIEINLGDTVVWVNEGIVAHNVTDTINGTASGDINVGTSWTMVPTADFDYYCSIHPTMTGSVKIKK